nr:hypothetical protein [uncultured Butyrivibrio sp.]
MKKSFSKKVLAMGMAISMMFVSACGRKEVAATLETTENEATVDKDHVYRWEDVEIPLEGNIQFISSCSSKDNLFTLVDYYEGHDTSPEVIKIDYATGSLEEIPLEASSKISYSQLNVDEEEKMYLIKTTYSDEYVEAVENDKELEYDEEFASENSTKTIIKLSETGELIWEAPLTEKDSAEYIGCTAYVSGRGILTCGDAGYSFYDKDSGVGTEIAGGEDENDYSFGYIYAVRDGNVYLYDNSYNEAGPIIKKFNPEKMAFDKEVSIPEEGHGRYRLYPGKAYDFYVDESDGIKAFNIGDEKTTLICEYLESDIVINYLTYIVDDKDGKLYVVNENLMEKSEIACMTKIDPSEIKEKEIITVGIIYATDDVKKKVSDFNKKSDAYRIQIVDYADEVSGRGMSGYYDCVNNLGLEFVQGQGPDVIVVHHAVSLQNFAAKGAFEPLDLYFEKDPDISISDLLTNVVDATRVNGNLYTVVPSFYISTCVVAKDKTDGQKVSLKNYKEICEKNGINPLLGMGYMPKDAASGFYETAISSYVDYDNGTCDFASEGFINLLEFLNPFQEGADEEEDFEKYEEFDTYYRENKSLLLETCLNTFEDYKLYIDGYFGTDVVFNGYPTDNGGESFITMKMQIAMNKNCKHKDVAWEFMKSFYDDDYQNKLKQDFPIKLSALEAKAVKAQESPYYLKSNGKKEYTGHTYIVGTEEIQLDELSAEEVNTVLDFIKSVTDVATSENTIVNIIEEEAGAYYAGQKTAEEVADIIQSRVSIYLSETR